MGQRTSGGTHGGLGTMHAHADAKEDFTSEIALPIRLSAPWRIAEVRPLPDFGLWVRFIDGTEGTVSMSGFLRSSHAGVFTALLDEAIFSRLYLEYGAVTWPGELDLAP